MEILYEDNSIIVIRKAAGVATQSANVAQKDCVSLIKEHLCGQEKADPYVGIIHRLDQPVEGILVFAKDQKTAAILSKQVVSDMMNKTYHALVEGIMPDEGPVKLTDMIYKDGRENRAVIVDESENAGKGAAKNKGRTSDKDKAIKKAGLIYEVCSLNEEEGTTLLKIDLITGRFHQIRAQLSHLGYPIVGDKKYGSKMNYTRDFKNNNSARRGAIALCADELTFKHPVSGKIMRFSID